MKNVLKSIALAGLLLLLIWICGTTVSAVLASPAPDTMMNGLFSASDSLGELLCKVTGV